jgi:hypothetical protein
LLVWIAHVVGQLRSRRGRLHRFAKLAPFEQLSNALADRIAAADPVGELHDLVDHCVFDGHLNLQHRLSPLLHGHLLNANPTQRHSMAAVAIQTEFQNLLKGYYRDLELHYYSRESGMGILPTRCADFPYLLMWDIEPRPSMGSI